MAARAMATEMAGRRRPVRYPDEELLSIEDVTNSWAVTKEFVKAHAAHEGRVARCLPELPAIVVKGRLFFEPLAVEHFSALTFSTSNLFGSARNRNRMRPDARI